MERIGSKERRDRRKAGEVEREGKERKNEKRERKVARRGEKKRIGSKEWRYG